MKIQCILIMMAVIYCSQTIELTTSLIYNPNIVQTYSIVKQYIYLPQKFQTKMPKNYYVLKLAKDNGSKAPKSHESTYQNQQFPPSTNITFDNDKYKTIQIKVADLNFNSIQQYNAIKNIYPNAVIPNQKQSTQTNKPPSVVKPQIVQAKVIQHKNDNSNLSPPDMAFLSQDLPVPGTKKTIEVDNKNKQIELNVKEIAANNNHVVQKNIQIQLQKVLQKKPSDVTIKPIQTTNAPPNTQNIKNPLQNTKNEDLNLGIQQKQINKQRYEQHRESLMFIVFLVVLLFVIFIVMQWRKKQSTSIWSSVQNKLGRYSSTSIEVLDDEQFTFQHEREQSMAYQQD